MPIIEVDHVTKEFRLGQLQGLSASALNALKRLRGLPVEKLEPFKALNDISFSVEEGEVVGIIGHNGAGKSTLLKSLSGVVTPTYGSIEVKGKVAPLIEVGAGLVGDMTGRENIYLNASILGMKRAEIRKKLDDIVSFSELDEFIDTPIKRYSSGMQIRLGFAIAISVNADILIVDEVLAVGDLSFQRKCFDRMEEIIRDKGNTVVLVSHNIRQVERLCRRVLMLDHGKLVNDGDKTEVCEIFYNLSNSKIAAQAERDGLNKNRTRTSGEIDLVSIELLDSSKNITNHLYSSEPATIRCIVKSTRILNDVEIVIGFHTTDFFYISSMSNILSGETHSLRPSTNSIDCCLANLPLMPGVYALRVGVFDSFRREIFYGEMLKTFRVEAKGFASTKTPELGIVSIPAKWSVN